jgi:membrane-bound lytic murein transglycosylase B
MKVGLLLLIALLANAGCAANHAAVPSAPATEAVVAPPSTPPPPMPPPPPGASAFLAGPEPILASTGDPRVDAFRDRVLAEGGSAWRPYLLRVFAGVRADPAILTEFDALAAIATPADYIRHYVSPGRIARGRALYRTLGTAGGVGSGDDLAYALALWGALADYGDRPPTRDTIQVLLTLGAYGKGPNWGEFDLFHAAGLIASGKVPRAQFRAYSSGRIGQAAWTVGQYEQNGRDGDGDGRFDVWTNRYDILANMRMPDPARLQGAPLVVAIKPFTFDPADPAQARRARSVQSKYNTAAIIFTRWDGTPWPDWARSFSGTYIEPYGRSGPAFLLSNWATPVNYRNPAKQRYWSDTEDMGFGLAVALLGETIAGRPLPPLPAK